MTQPRYEAPGDLVEYVKCKWLISGEWGCLLDNGRKLAVGQSNSSSKKKIQPCKKWCLQNFYWIKKLMMLDIVDKNAFETMTLLDNLVLICRFWDSNFMFCSLYMICEICVFLRKNDSWKLQLESWNANLELLNRTL